MTATCSWLAWPSPSTDTMTAAWAAGIIRSALIQRLTPHGLPREALGRGKGSPSLGSCSYLSRRCPGGGWVSSIGRRNMTREKKSRGRSAPGRSRPARATRRRAARCWRQSAGKAPGDVRSARKQRSGSGGARRRDRSTGSDGGESGGQRCRGPREDRAPPRALVRGARPIRRGHQGDTASARHLNREHKVQSWYSQAITLSYQRAPVCVQSIRRSTAASGVGLEGRPGLGGRDHRGARQQAAAHDVAEVGRPRARGGARRSLHRSEAAGG